MVKEININQLRKGMFVCGTDRKWIDLPFLRAKFLVSSDKQIHRLQEYCQIVYIDTAKGLDVVQQTDSENANQAIDPEISAISAIEKIYNQAQILFGELLKEVRFGRELDGEKVDKIAADLLLGVTSDSQAMIKQIRPSHGKQDELAHKSVNACILALAFGQHLALSSESLRLLALGGLLHDIGMVGIPEYIKSKPQALTRAERIVVAQHPEHGAAILAKVAKLPAEVIDIAATHHETMSGDGYPERLPAARIGELSRMISIVSVYEAMTSRRPYREAMIPLTAMDYLYGSGESAFDALLLANFIQALGVYPVACVVQLQTGELAIVEGDNPLHPRRPQLRIVTNPQKQLMFQAQLLDLADARNADTVITGVLASNEPFIELLKMFTAQEKV
ncbi:HD-GYP domain-containing protein [Methylomonas sp. 2BW1-5-20]|uniref:HD-GYP domain-containing protein n=1 Tax=Methylomonas sp. 2BW1-5-20 TaxID=3376686 RepID=UPI004050DC77